jgi:hypothetical protein
MSKLFLFALASAISVCAAAQDGATKMTREELLAFLPGTKVTHVAQSGSLRNWINEPDGKFVASTDNKKFGSALGTSTANSPGTWRVDDSGKYCIEIDWKRINEKWCSFILKSADGNYYLNVADDKHKIEFAK